MSAAPTLDDLFYRDPAVGLSSQFCSSKEKLAKSFGSPRPDCSRHASTSRYETLRGVMWLALTICTTPDEGSGAPSINTAT
jgi:hypothetical protein